MKKPIFQKRGDILLFVLVLAVLTATLFHPAVKKFIIPATVPNIVFTQWWEDDLEKDTLLEIIKEFESLHGGLKIVLKASSYEDVRSGLFSPVETASLVEAQYSDILALDLLWVPELLKMGIIESPGPALLSSINVLYYNVEILKEAEFSRPPKSRGEFINYARVLAGRGKNRWGLTMGGNSSGWIYDDVLPWIWAAGAELLKDGKPDFASRAVVEGLSFLASLNDEGLIAPGAFTADNRKKLEDFISGRAVFMIAPVRDIRLVRERMGDEAFGITSVPIPDNYAGKTFFANAGWTVGIHSASAHKEEARLFADFLAGKASIFSEETRAVPGNLVPPAQDPFYSKAWEIAISGEPAQDFNGLPWMELEAVFKEELSALFEEKSSPTGVSAAETALAIQQRWEAVLTGRE